MKICGIYKITSPSNKIYVGQSIDIEVRKNKYKRLSCKAQPYLYNSLIKYGWENHIFEIICKCNVFDLNIKEKYYIELLQTFNSVHGLNLKAGGDGGGLCSDATKIKLSESHMAQKAWNKGIKMSAEQYAKCEDTMFKKGSKGLRKGIDVSDITKNKMRNAKLGKKLTEEHKLKISKKLYGRPTWNKGKKMPKKFIEKLKVISLHRERNEKGQYT